MWKKIDSPRVDMSIAGKTLGIVPGVFLYLRKLFKEVSKLNQIYKKENFIIIPVENNFLVVNINKIFKEGHTHVKSMGIARLLIDLAVEKRLPKNPYFVESLIRISIDKCYIDDLKKFKEDGFIGYKELMESHFYKRHKGAMRQVR